jgi:sugar lactone lactonase YvrE
MKKLGTAKLLLRPSQIAAMAGIEEDVTLTESIVFDPRTQLIHLVEINLGLHVRLNASNSSPYGATKREPHLAGVGLMQDPNVVALVHTHRIDYLRTDTEKVTTGPAFERGLNTRANHVGYSLQGHLMFSSLGLNFASPSPSGSLFRVINGEVEVVVPGFCIGNGFGYTEDGKSLITTDSGLGGKGVMRYNANPETGDVDLSSGRLFAETCDGLPYPRVLPDGLWIGGNLVWIAEWGCFRVAVYNADGTEFGFVDVPTKRPTHSVLVGRRLYITSELIPGDEDNDEAGGIFVADLGDDFAPAKTTYCHL